MENEFVYVINLAGLEKIEGLLHKKFSREAMDLVGFNLAFLEGHFRDRNEAEKDPTTKQVIPYIIFAADDDTYLVYQRTGSEERLAGGYSMGIGGHINELDAGGEWKAEMIWACMKRELEEELDLSDLSVDDLTKRASLKGILYDDENAVGRVHLGVVYEITVKSEDKAKFSMCSEGKNLSWLSGEALNALGDELENWSQIVLEAM